MNKIKDICVGRDVSIKELLGCINRGARGLALVLDEGRLEATISDGDVRRAILDGVELDSSVRDLLQHKKSQPLSHSPVTANIGATKAELVQIMRKNAIQQIPLLDDSDRVVDIIGFGEIAEKTKRSCQAVIMAGGLGTRLRPLTEDLPKPMLPLGGRPLLEHTLERLRNVGISRINITTHFCPERIINHFGDGAEHDVSLTYIHEDTPLGTAGALGLMDPPLEPILLINGDIITEVDFDLMLSFHKEHGAKLTIGMREFEMEVPYGVLRCRGPEVLDITEKPVYKFYVNAGMYLIEPEVHGLIPRGQHFDMTELAEAVIAEGGKVVGFPIIEYWLDIGQHRDYQQAQDYWGKERITE